MLARQNARLMNENKLEGRQLFLCSITVTVTMTDKLSRRMELLGC